MRCVVLRTGETPPQVGTSARIGALESGTHCTTPPDRVLIVRDERPVVLARASVWCRRTPLLHGERTGFIGHFASVDSRASAVLLDAACKYLSENGCGQAVGPIDGDTWHAYRFIVEGSDAPRFVFEPDHPADWPRHFRAAGFGVLTTYSSSVVEDLARTDARIPVARDRLAAAGVHIRELDLSRWNDELARVHDLSLVAFSSNFLYTPIPLNVFASLMEPLRPLVDPCLVLLAERQGVLLGFVFAMPDPGLGPRSLIVKTLAVLPGRAQQGLGAVLVACVHDRARRLGYRRAVHALMHDGNGSRHISRRYGQPFRRYALLSRSLEAGRR